jgi:hypothetical protein
VTSRPPLGQILVEQGKIDSTQLLSALAHQRRWGGRLGEAVAALGFMREADVLQTVARQLGVPFLHLGDRRVAPAVLRRLPEKLVRARHLFPLGVIPGARRDALVVATPDPQNLHALDEAAFASSLVVRPVLSSAADVERAIERHYGKGLPPWNDAAIELRAAASGPMRVVPFAHPIH